MFTEELAQRLVANGVGVINTSIFSGAGAIIPTGDGPYITIVETGGQAPTRTQNQKAGSTRRPSAQIMVRAASRAVARAKALEAFTALDGIFNETLSGVSYLSVTARQEPADAGVDGQKRAQVVFNVLAEKAPS